MSIAYITGGQYVPMINARLLAQVIIGSVREEISLERLMQDAQEDIDNEMKQAEVDGADEQEVATRINRLLIKRNARVKQMENLGGATSSVAKETYSKCVDMKELRSQYKIEPIHYERQTRAAVRRSAAGGLMNTIKSYMGFGDKEEASVESATFPKAEMNYNLHEDEEVSMAQTERIVQRMRSKKK